MFKKFILKEKEQKNVFKIKKGITWVIGTILNSNVVRCNWRYFGGTLDLSGCWEGAASMTLIKKGDKSFETPSGYFRIDITNNNEVQINAPVHEELMPQIPLYKTSLRACMCDFKMVSAI